MYLTEILENTHKQDFGEKYHPDPERDAYILVRRIGTSSWRAKEVEISRRYPPMELLDKKAREEQAAEKLCEMMREYYVVDMVGFKDENGDFINYQKKKNQIFAGDQSLGLINGVLQFSSESANYSQNRSAEIKEKLEQYIKVNIIEEADNDDWIQLFFAVGADEYEKARVDLDANLTAMLSVYFDLKRDARGEVLTRQQCVEGARLIDHDFYDCIDILIHIDDFYTRKNNERIAKRAAK